MHNHEDAKKFRKAYKITFGKLIPETEEFCAKIGSAKRSFTDLKYKTRIDDSAMNEVIKILRASLKSDKPNTFHRLLVK